jgi:hypothetical protein
MAKLMAKIGHLLKMCDAKKRQKTIFDSVRESKILQPLWGSEKLIRL